MTDYEVEAVDKAQMMKRLVADPLFKQLILEEYIQNQAIDLGTNYTEGGAETLKAISNLNQYIQTIIIDGEMASNSKD